MGRKTKLILLVALLGLALMSCQFVEDLLENGDISIATEAPAVNDLSGTRWRVTYYDKAINQTMSYDLIFNAGGRLGNTNPYESTPDNDFWSQSGSTVTITFNNAYATYVGQISGTNMSGTATNIRDMEWTWEAYLLP